MQSDSSYSASDSLNAEFGSLPSPAAAAPPLALESPGERLSTGSSCISVPRKPREPLANCADCELPIFWPSSLVVNATTRNLAVMGSIPSWVTTSAERTLRSRVQFPERLAHA